MPARRLALPIRQTGGRRRRGSPARVRTEPRYRTSRAGRTRFRAASTYSSRSTTAAKLAGRPICLAQSWSSSAAKVDSSVSPVTYGRGTPFAVTHHPIGQRDPNHEVLADRPLKRSMPDHLLERDRDFEELEAGNGHSVKPREEKKRHLRTILVGIHCAVDTCRSILPRFRRRRPQFDAWTRWFGPRHLIAGDTAA